MSITTASIWVCTRCGTVSHVDGGIQPSSIVHGVCSSNIETHRHVLKPVLVVIPYA